MCNSCFGGNNCWCIILVILLFVILCGGCGGCNNDCGNCGNNGCGCGCWVKWIKMCGGENSLKERVSREKRGTITKFFRTLTKDGSYVWKAHTIMYNADSNSIIYCTRFAPITEDGFALCGAPWVCRRPLFLKILFWKAEAFTVLVNAFSVLSGIFRHIFFEEADCKNKRLTLDKILRLWYDIQGAQRGSDGATDNCF